MAYTRKFLKASNAASDERFARAFRIASRTLAGTKFEEIDGFRVRQWGDGMEDWVTPEDVRAWLLGLRVVEDLRTGLEFVRETYIHNVLIREGYLRKDETTGLYWITKKAAQRFDLPKVLGRDFPK